MRALSSIEVLSTAFVEKAGRGFASRLVSEIPVSRAKVWLGNP
jgi:hypothetical protein